MSRFKHFAIYYIAPNDDGINIGNNTEKFFFLRIVFEQFRFLACFFNYFFYAIHCIFSKWFFGGNQYFFHPVQIEIICDLPV